jgi:hypothetical protein
MPAKKKAKDIPPPSVKLQMGNPPVKTDTLVF